MALRSFEQVASGSDMQGVSWETEKCDLRWSVKTKADSLKEEQLKKLGKEEEEPATKQRREYTDVGVRDEHVACHAAGLAMTDEARREAEIKT